MRKWSKFCIGLLLLPVCWGGARALGRVIEASGRADTVWVACGAGAAAWLGVYLLLPKPMRLYVFGHELTHALWAWLFGGQVRRFKVSAGGGQVVTTRSNFLIVLAPYFFPIYAVGVVAAYALGRQFWDWSAYRAWFHLLLGAAYAFHVSLTAHVLRTRQTDITEQGYLFSAVVIWLGNLGVLLVGLPLLASGPRWSLVARWCWEESAAAFVWLGHLFVTGT